MSNSLQSCGLQNIKLPCPSPTPGACSNSCPSSWWWQPTISSSIVPFSTCLQSFLASGSFPLSQFFISGGQSIGASASALVLPMNIPLGLTYFSLLQAKGFSKVFSNMTVQNYQFFWHSDFFMVQLSHPYMTTGKTTVLTRQTFVGKVMVLLSNTLSMFVITFLPRRKKVSFNFMAAVTTCSDYGAQENKVFHFQPLGAGS